MDYGKTWVMTIILFLVPVAILQNPDALRSLHKKNQNVVSLPYVINYPGKNGAFKWVCCSALPTAACLQSQRSEDCPRCMSCLPSVPGQEKLGEAQYFINKEANINIGADFKWPVIRITAPDDNRYNFPTNSPSKLPNEASALWDFVPNRSGQRPAWSDSDVIHLRDPPREQGITPPPRPNWPGPPLPPRNLAPPQPPRPPRG